MQNEFDFQQLTRDVEQGKENAACELARALHKVSFGDKIQALNLIKQTNEVDRKAAPELPEIKVSNKTVTYNSFDKKNEDLNREICEFLQRPCTETHQELKMEISKPSMVYTHDMNLDSGEERSSAGGQRNCRVFE